MLEPKQKGEQTRGEKTRARWMDRADGLNQTNTGANQYLPRLTFTFQTALEELGEPGREGGREIDDWTVTRCRQPPYKGPGVTGIKNENAHIVRHLGRKWKGGHGGRANKTKTTATQTKGLNIKLIKQAKRHDTDVMKTFRRRLLPRGMMGCRHKTGLS